MEQQVVLLSSLRRSEFKRDRFNDIEIIVSGNKIWVVFRGGSDHFKSLPDIDMNGGGSCDLGIGKMIFMVISQMMRKFKSKIDIALTFEKAHSEEYKPYQFC